MSKHEQPTFSGRHMVKGLGVTFATAAVPSALSQIARSNPPSQPLQNQISKYPKPPFKSQSQPWPALASKMDRRPDHGETSYRGSNLMAGRKALITGGDSGMGRAAAIAFAREGADVAINYLPEEEPDARDGLQL